MPSLFQWPSWRHPKGGATFVPGGPRVYVEAAFGFGPLAAQSTLVWTDLTDYVREIRTHRGRSRDIDEWTAGTCTIVLSNRLRTFDPEYTVGPYYGNLKPLVPIRVSAEYAGTTYRLFTGFADGWPQSYVRSHDSTVTLRCTDAFKLFASIMLPASLFEFVMLETAGVPSHWWKLNDVSGSIAKDFAATATDGAYYDSPTLNQTAIVTYDDAPSVKFTSGVFGDGMVVGAGGLPTSGKFSIGLWLKTDQVAAEDAWLFSMVPAWPSLVSGIPNPWLSAHLESTDGTLEIRVYNDAGTGAIVAGATDLTGDVAHFVVVTVDATANPITFKGIVNGVQEISDTLAGTWASQTTSGRIVWGDDHQPGINNEAFDGWLSHALIWDGTVLTAAQCLDIYNAGKNGLAETTGTRIGRTLDYVGWGSADRAIDTGNTTLAAYDLASQSALTYLQLLNRSEAGGFYILGNGYPNFRQRHAILSEAAYNTSNATFGDSGAELRYTEIETEYDDTEIDNEVRVTRSGGVEQAYLDSASKSTYGLHTFSQSGLLLNDDAEARYKAEWHVGHRKDPYFRVRRLTIAPRRAEQASSLWPQVLGRELEERITVVRRPQGVGSAISKQVLIQSVSHTITRDKEWTTTWELSPAEIEQYWILDDPVYSLLGETTRLAY